MKLERTVQPLPPPPPKHYVLTLDEREMLYLYALSYRKECGDNFPNDRRLHDVLREQFPELRQAFNRWRNEGSRAFSPINQLPF